MTVRTWVTISVLAMTALAIAVVVRLMQPAPVPEILARVGEVRIEGTLVSSCWPQRGGETVCKDNEDADDPARATIPGEGRLRFAAYPVEPKDAEIVFAGKTYEWEDDINYELDPGRYAISVNADYGEGNRVRYAFSLRVT